MSESCRAQRKTLRGAAASFCEKSLDYSEPSEAASVLLNAEEYKAETGDDEEQPKLEILSTVKELIPGPNALGEWHGDDLNSDYEKQNTAEAHGGARNSKECGEAGLRGYSELDHAVPV